MIDPYDSGAPGRLYASVMARSAVRLAFSRYRLLLASVSAVLVPTAVIGGVAFGVWRPSGTASTRISASEGIGLVVLVLGSLLAQAAGVYAAIGSAEGGETTWRQSASVALHRWGACLSTGVLVMLGIGIGVFCFIIPGLVVFVAWFVAMPSVVIEGRSPGSALGRSWQLTRGHRLSILGAFVLVELLSLLAFIPLNLIVNVIFSGTSASVAQEVAGYIVQILLTPLQVALVAVVYLGLRGIYEQVTPAEILLEAGLKVPDASPTFAEPPYPATPWSTDVPVTETPPPGNPPEEGRGSSWQLSPKPPEPRPQRRASDGEPPPTE